MPPKGCKILFDLCFVLTTFEHTEHAWRGFSYAVLSKGPVHLVALYDSKGYGGHILTRIFTDGIRCRKKIWKPFTGNDERNILERDESLLFYNWSISKYPKPKLKQQRFIYFKSVRFLCNRFFCLVCIFFQRYCSFCSLCIQCVNGWKWNWKLDLNRKFLINFWQKYACEKFYLFELLDPWYIFSLFEIKTILHFNFFNKII